jgi:hypothetical protein
MKHVRRRRAAVPVLLMLAMLTLVAGCDSAFQDPAFQEGPKGFVEFYIPEPKLGEEGVKVDVQVFRMDGGKRIFLGMTKKWNGLAETRRGLTAAVPPGRQDFVVAHGDAETGISVAVREGGYHRVRIGFTAISNQQMIGTSEQLSFGIQATVDPLP